VSNAIQLSPPGLESNLFKSTDGAASWNPLGTGTVGLSIIRVNPLVPSTLYAIAGYNSFLTSANSGQN